MDPLSDVLALLKPRSYKCGGLDIGGELCVQFSRHEGIKCYAMVSGSGWLQVEGVAEPVELKAGDCFVLPLGRPFLLATALGLRAVDAETMFSASAQGRIATWNGGGSALMVGSFFSLSGGQASTLLSVLPPVIHIRKEADRAVMRWAMNRMRDELGQQQPGGFLIAEQLATMILVQALRLYLEEKVTGGVGWLCALADAQMSAAISAMHTAPSYRWTLQELAERAGMSRSTFALRFKETVGQSPMEYLTNWRMLVAGDRLVNSLDSIAEIAAAMGYDSESAFSTAFKRVMGRSPRQYSRAGGIVADRGLQPEPVEELAAAAV